MKKIVILTGAGAVIPWNAPSTDKITQRILNDNSLNAKNKPLGLYLFEKLSPYYYADPQNINFEFIIDLIEVFLDYYDSCIQGRRTVFKSSFSAIFNIKKEIEKDILGFSPKNKTDLTSAFGFFSNAYKLFINLIIEEIEKYSNIFSQYQCLNKNFDEFLSQFKNYKIRFYTTNYDRLPIKCSNKEFFDGFDLKDKQYFKYNPNKIFDDEVYNSYFNLHGSIYFKTEQIKIYSPMMAGYFDWVCTPDQINKIDNSTPYNRDQNRKRLPGTNILAGLSKSPRIFISPQYQFYQKFHFDCISADIILIIGYSYGDIHINAAIKNGIQVKNSQIINITYHDNWINQIKHKKFNNNLKILWINSFPYSQFLEDLLSLYNENINRRRDDSGWLNSDSHSLRIYWKGFEEFLKNNEWIGLLNN